MHGGRSVGENSEAYVGFDTSKTKHAVAIADGGRGGEVRFVGDVAGSPARVERLIRKLAERYGKLHFCYEAGPTGYGLYRQIKELGYDCTVVAASLIPRKPGERIKTNRRDAVSLARLLRAGELTACGCPMPPMKRCATWFAPAPRRRRICAANVSSGYRFCCGTAASSTAASTGPWRIAVGWRTRASPSGPANRLPGRDRRDRGCLGAAAT